MKQMRMKKNGIWLSRLIVVALCLQTTFFNIQSPICSAQTREVHILSVNDMHANMSAMPQVAAIADSLRSLYPSLLVFSAGDNRTGTPVNDKYEIPGYPMVALMNQIGFNGSAIGNHEFDVKSLPALTRLSTFRYLCANMKAPDSTGISYVPCQVFDVDGVKVGVVGVIQLNQKGIPSTHPDNLVGLSFKPAEEVVAEYEWMRSECDVTILLSHAGYDEDVNLANRFPWLDLIIGGHTHTQLNESTPRPNDVLITQNKNKLQRVTHTTLTVDGGRVTKKQAEYIDVKSFPKSDKLMDTLVDYFSHNPIFQNVIATATTPFEKREEFGCMMCDAFMEEAGADLAVQNPGGVRLDSHPAGDITMLDILEMDPFDNNFVVLTLTGTELLTMMMSYCHNSLYSFPFVGGFKCELTLAKYTEDKIRSVQLFTPDGKPLDMKRRYRVATNNYITATSTIPEGAMVEINKLTTDIIRDYLQKHQTVDYNGVSRIKVKKK